MRGRRLKRQETARERGRDGALALALALAIASALGATLAVAVIEAGTPAIPDEHAHAASGRPAASTPITDASLYNLDSAWRDGTGEERRLASLAGRVQLVSMVYTHCAHTCPRVLADMKRIEARLGADGAEVGFVLISLDPERDTPERLREFAASVGLDPHRWTLLTGRPADVREVAAVLGVSYRPDGETEIAHTNLIAVLDGAGEIRHRQLGLGGELAETVAAVRSALGRTE